MGDKEVILRYFTGTGNSKRILEIIKEGFEKNGYTVSFCPITEEATIAADNYEYLGIAFPVYSWGVPRLVRKFLKNLPEVRNGQKTFVVVTSGGKNQEGWALTEARSILAQKGYIVTNSDAVHMPNNWIVMSSPPPQEEALVILEKGEKQAEELAAKIISGAAGNKAFRWPTLGPLALLLHYIFKYYGVFRMWRLFKSSSKCTSCSLCSKICPTKSISMIDGKPVWGPKCEQCMRCINCCPEKAIEQMESIGRGSRRERYREPHFDPME